ncbi:MAG: DNA primase [Parcubacteria group bacterium]|nr:DNA primase [Parcubacteria group bacterium]
MSRDVEEIKQRLDIVDVVGQYVQLKKAGANHKGICPFHRENSPSFMVSQTKQIWHCFGCNEGGDMFSFIEKTEGLDFYGALKLLADRAGVKIEKTQSPQAADKKERLRDIVELSAKFFHKILTEHPQSQAARDYAASRALSKETIDRFVIGYAPDTWDVLLTFLKQRGYSAAEAAEAGLAVFNQERNSFYDRFRGRLMIPLRDVQGRIVGFTARAIAKDFVGGKYINTPQTPLYDKSRVVFALSEAKQAIKEAGCVVVVEGNMDAIASHQVGVKNVVAVSGTAFTEAQISQLKRFTDTLVFSFDADAAGELAQGRGIELALRQGMNVKVLTLPYGKDPDECIRKDLALWIGAITAAQPVLDAVLNRALAKNDRHSSAGKKQITSDVLMVLRYLSNPVEREHYVRLLADELQVSAAILYELLKKFEADRPAATTKEGKQKTAAGGGDKAPALPSTPEEDALRDILALVIVRPELIDTFELPVVPESAAHLLTLYKSWKSFYDSSINSGEIPLNYEAFLQRLDDHLQTLFPRLQLYGETEYADLTIPEATQAIVARVTFLKRRQLQMRLHQIQRALKEAEKLGDQSAMQPLMAEFSSLSSQLAALE